MSRINIINAIISFLPEKASKKNTFVHSNLNFPYKIQFRYPGNLKKDKSQYFYMNILSKYVKICKTYIDIIFILAIIIRD